LTLSKVLRILLLLTVGIPYLAVKGLVLVTRKAWQVIVIHRGLQIVLSFLLFLFLLGIWKFGPLLTGRLALHSAAELLALNSEGRNTLDMENDLRRRAFRLGFRGAITQPDAVSIERTNANGITLCTITFEFRREVDLLGLWRKQVPVSGKVEVPVEPGGERGKSLDDILVR
jgi:hypothetical protein